MKLGYYGYFFEHTRSKKRYRNDLRPLLKQFCEVTKPSYKNSFISLTDEHMYLFRVAKDTYMFVMTKSHEIIKKIDTAKIDVEEIYNKLGRDDKLGFASYIFFGDCYYGIASTIQGPRNRSFVYFVNRVLESVGVKRYEFNSFAIMHQASKAEVLKMPFVGKTIVQVGEGNNLFDYMKGFLGDRVKDVDSFIIEIRPRRRQSIKESISAFSSKLSDEGLLKYIVKAKESQEELLEDFYIASSGGVSDMIYAREDGKIYEEMREKAKANQTLTTKVDEFKNAKEYSSDQIQAIADLGNSTAWANHLSSL